MEEEKFAKAPRTPYIIFYAVVPFIALSFIITGCFYYLSLDSEVQFLSWFLIALGAVLLVASVYWLIYFIRLPQYAITYKDGKLYFRNKLICTPAELENFNSKGGGLDGAMMGFGRLFVWVHGKRYKFNYISDVDSVVRRLFIIKAEYEVKQNIAQKTAEAGDENG